MKLWNVLMKKRTPEYLIVLMKNLYVDQQFTVSAESGRTNHVGTEVRQGCILSPCLFNLNEEQIRRETEREEDDQRFRKRKRKINNL